MRQLVYPPPAPPCPLPLLPPSTHPSLPSPHPLPSHPLLTGMEAGLLMTTRCSSSCMTRRGSSVTGGSWRCTRWHTRALFVITVSMVAVTLSTVGREGEGGRGRRERGGRKKGEKRRGERKGRVEQCLGYFLLPPLLFLLLSLSHILMD